MKFLVFFIRFIVIKILIDLVLIGPDAINVVQTGMCPGAPTDIQPYPCTLSEFLERMYFGGFAIIGHMFFSGIAFSIAMVLTLIPNRSSMK